MTTEQAAAQLGVDVSLVSRWCRDGVIRAKKIGNSWWITPGALAKFETERRGRGRPPTKKG